MSIALSQDNIAVVAASKGFFSKWIDGDFGLAKTYWLLGFLPSFVLNIVSKGIPESLSVHAWLLVLLPVSVYQGIITVSTWRAAKQYAGPSFFKFLGHLGSIVWGIGFVVSIMLCFSLGVAA